MTENGRELMPMITADELNSISNLGKMFLESGLFSDTKNISQAVVKMLAGREQGMQPFESMRDINIIQGKTCLAGAQIAARIIKAGGLYEALQFDEKGCILRFSRNGKVCKPDISFSFEDAKRLGLTGKDNYLKQARTMLFWRALTMGARMIFPDVFGGSIYTPDEMKGEIDNEPVPIQATIVESSNGAKPTAVQEVVSLMRQEVKKAAKRNTRPTKGSKVEFREADPFAPSGDFQAIPPDYVPLKDDSLPGDEPPDDDYNQEQPMPLDDPWQHQLEANIFGADGTAYKGMTLKQIGVGRLKYIFKTEDYKKLLTENDVVNMVECLANPSDTGLLHTNIAHRNDPDYLMPFGKHKGERVADIEPSYFVWLQDNKPELLEKFSDLKEWLRTNAE